MILKVRLKIGLKTIFIYKKSGAKPPSGVWGLKKRILNIKKRCKKNS
jgi:hypothetical protein